MKEIFELVEDKKVMEQSNLQQDSLQNKKPIIRSINPSIEE